MADGKNSTGGWALMAQPPFSLRLLVLAVVGGIRLLVPAPAGLCWVATAQAKAESDCHDDSDYCFHVLFWLWVSAVIFQEARSIAERPQAQRPERCRAWLAVSGLVAYFGDRLAQPRDYLVERLRDELLTSEDVID